MSFLQAYPHKERVHTIACTPFLRGQNLFLMSCPPAELVSASILTWARSNIFCLFSTCPIFGKRTIWNYQHPEYMTSPLIESVRRNHLEIIKLLLISGALPETKEVYSNKSTVEIAADLGNNKAIVISNQYLAPSKRLNIKTQKIL